MPVKKTINSEPEWDITPSKTRSVSTPTWGATITLNSPNSNGVIYANINFGERAAMLFRGKHIKFSSKALPEKLCFKESTQGYKATSSKTVTVKIPLSKEIEDEFVKLWAYKSYQLKEAKGYYYFEQDNELVELFEEEPEPVPTDNSPYPKLIATNPVGTAYLRDDYKTLWNKMAKTYVETVDGNGENGIGNKKHLYKLMKLVLDGGYATVNVPIITEDGRRAIATVLFNGTGRWEE